MGKDSLINGVETTGQPHAKKKKKTKKKNKTQTNHWLTILHYTQKLTQKRV